MTNDGVRPLAKQLSYMGISDEQSNIPLVCVVVEGRSMSFIYLIDDLFSRWHSHNTHGLGARHRYAARARGGL